MSVITFSQNIQANGMQKDYQSIGESLATHVEKDAKATISYVHSEWLQGDIDQWQIHVLPVQNGDNDHPMSMVDNDLNLWWFEKSMRKWCKANNLKLIAADTLEADFDENPIILGIIVQRLYA